MQAQDRLKPWGLCINKKEQIVVGLRSLYKMPPIKLTIFSQDGSTVLKEIENDVSGRPLFTSSIYQVKQNGNGDYVVADKNRIVCVSREGEYRWKYRVKQTNPYEIPSVFGMVCDRYDNIIIAEFRNDKISMIDSEGISDHNADDEGGRYTYLMVTFH